MHISILVQKIQISKDNHKANPAEEYSSSGQPSIDHLRIRCANDSEAQIFNQCIQSVFTYDNEIWAFNKEIPNKMQADQKADCWTCH